MDWIDDTLVEFGRQLGIESLRLNAQGTVRLTLTSGMPVTLEPRIRRGHQEILVSMGCTVGHAAPQRTLQALRMAHTESFPPVDIQLALSGNGVDTLLIATTRLTARGFTVTALSGAIAALGQWLSDVSSTEDRHG